MEMSVDLLINILSGFPGHFLVRVMSDDPSLKGEHVPADTILSNTQDEEIIIS